MQSDDHPLHARSPFHLKWGTADEDVWLDVMLRSINEPTIDGVDFPTMPDESKQMAVQGTSNAVSIKGSHQFYGAIRKFLSENGLSLSPGKRLLDFGSGWGRTIRPFMKDFDLSDLFAVEPHEPSYITTKQCNPYISVVHSDYEPPLPFPDDYFSFIVSYSIFSHLPEFMFDSWMNEFERILLPGGVACFTFLGDTTMRQLSKYPDPLPDDYEAIHPWHRSLVKYFEKSHWSDYKDGKFIFLKTGGMDRYGDTFMSPDLVRAKIGRKFNILTINSHMLAQDLCLIQKRPS